MHRSMGSLGGPLALVVAIVTAGCVQARFVQTGAPYPPKPADCAIEVFSSGPPDRAYDEIGILEGEGSEWKAHLDDVLPKLQEEACLAGGDAIILQSANRYEAGDDLESTRLYAMATVIRWREGS